jgi:hypothetical protein
MLFYSIPTQAQRKPKGRGVSPVLGLTMRRSALRQSMPALKPPIQIAVPRLEDPSECRPQPNEWKKVTGGKIPYSIEMKDNSPFVFAGLWEGFGKILRLKSGCAPAQLSRASEMNWSRKYTLECQSFYRRKPTTDGCSERPGRKFYGRSRPKK